MKSIQITVISVLVMAVTAFASADDRDLSTNEGRRQHELDKLDDRYRLFQAAREAWIGEVCQLSNEQRAELRSVGEQMLKKAVSELGRDASDIDLIYSMISPELIVEFGHGKLGASRLRSPEFVAQLATILSVDQLSRYQSALDKRSRQIQEGIAQQIVNLIDEDLFLNPSQRHSILTLLTQDCRFVPQDLYSTSRYYVHSTAGDRFDPLVEQLSHAQCALWKELVRRDGGAGKHLGICAAQMTPAECFIKLYEAADLVSDQYEQTIQVRFDYVSSIHHLDDENARLLKVAAHGIAQRELLEWRQRMHSYYFQLITSEYADHTVMVNIPQRTSDIDLHPINQLIASQYDFQSASQAREREIRSSSFEFIMAILDQELWLTSQQFDQVQSVVKTAFQDVEVPDRAYDDADMVVGHCLYPDVLLLARLLVQSSFDEILPLLSAEQKAVFHRLKSLFKLKGKAIYCKNAQQIEYILGFVDDNQYREEQFRIN